MLMHQDLQEYKFFKELQAFSWVEAIWLFGSRARGDNTERADIDLAIICPTATASDWIKILEVIEQADTLLKIDCVRFDTLAEQDLLRHNILRFKKILYTKEAHMTEIFWKDYFITLGQAINRLAQVMHHPDLHNNDFMQDAAIQRFEFVTELFWKVLKKVLAYEKITAITPRDVINKAYQFNLINDEAIWLQMLNDRNNTSHIYKQEDALQVFNNIKIYLPVFENTYAMLKHNYKL